MNYKEVKEKIVNYLKETRAESKKVIWPGKDYVVAATIIVFIIVFLVAVFIMLVDFGFAKFFAYMPKARLR